MLIDQATMTSLATAGAASAAGFLTYAVRGRSAEILAPHADLVLPSVAALVE